MFQLFRNPSYRRTALQSWADWDVSQWIDVGRIPQTYTPRSYPLEKIFFSALPPSWHRFCVDSSARRQFIQFTVFEPIRLLVSQPARERWLEAILRAEFERGAASPQKANDLFAQVREPRLQGFIRDLGINFGLDIFSRLLYIALAGYGLSSGDFFPFGLAVLSPIPPSGPLRFLYVLVRFLIELPELLRHPPSGHPLSRLLLARLGALAIAPLRWVGNLFPLVEISAVYPRLAFLLMEHFISRATALIPILGGRGKLLEIWIFQLCFNLPLSLRYLIERLWIRRDQTAGRPDQD
jgi:hypothetical protein